MDLFRVETGAVPGQSCSEETMPILKRSPRKDEPPLNPTVFLINDSLASIANISFMFTDLSDRSKDYPTKPTSPVKQKDSERDPPKSPEYRQLSPKNLEDPIYPSGKTNLSAKCSSSETERLLEKNNNVLNISEKRDSRPGPEQLLKDENELKQSSTILALAASQPDQPSTSSAYLSGNSPPGSGKKKTLGELAKEWDANQSPDEKKDMETKVNKAVVSTTEDDDTSVRHSTYYSTSSSVHGMSSHECRLRNKLKARRHLNRDEVYQEKKTGSPPLIKLHAVGGQL